MAGDLKKKNALSKLEALAQAQMQSAMPTVSQPPVPTKAPPFAPPSRVSPGLLGQTKASVPGFPQKRAPPARATLAEVESENQRLPREFKVVHPAAMVRTGPSLTAKAVSVKTRGDVVSALEETSDDWIRILDGWMLLDMHGQGGVGTLLEASGMPTQAVTPQEEQVNRLPDAILPISFALEVPPDSWHLPTHRFKVACAAVIVRSEPTLNAKACDVTRRDEIVHGVEETFDGWVRILQPAGWILRDLRGYCGIELLLERCGTATGLVVSELAATTGPQVFTALVDMPVMAEPTEDADVLASLQPGDTLCAETQTYHGWLRLPNQGGWVRGCDDQGTSMASCQYLKDRTLRRIMASQAEAKAQREATAEEALARELEQSAEVWDQIASAGASPSSRTAVGQSSGSEPRRRQYVPVPMTEEESFARYHGIKDFNYPKLPECEFLVVTAQVLVRAEPKLSGAVCGQLVKDQVVRGWEETFDGWVHLSAQPGWALQHTGEQEEDRGKALQAIDAPELMAVREGSIGPARRMFEVVCEPKANMLKEPKSTAVVKGSRACGQFVLAEAQTYHGWVRLADNLGWMQSNSRGDGQLLRSVSALEHAAPLLALTAPEEDEEERLERLAKEEAQRKELEMKQKAKEEASNSALSDLEAAAASGDAAVFRAAIKAAKANGVSKKDVARVNAIFSLSMS